MFALLEIAFLLRIVSNLALATQQVKCTCITLQRNISVALKFNSKFVFASGKHKPLTYLLQFKHVKIKKLLIIKIPQDTLELKRKAQCYQVNADRDKLPRYTIPID